MKRKSPTQAGDSGGVDCGGDGDCNVCEMLVCCCIFEHCPCYGDLPAPNGLGASSGDTNDDIFTIQPESVPTVEE